MSVAVRIVTMSVAGLVLLAAPASGQDPFADIPRAHVLILGTFHFDNPGADDYKPVFPWSPFTPEHQREIVDVVDRLARYGPTRIALEWPSHRQAELDSLYAAYVAGRLPASANERQQLGFRLARQLGHARVYAVDGDGRAYEPTMTESEYNSRVASMIAVADPALVARQQELEKRFAALHRQDDSLKTTMSLKDYLVRENAAPNVGQGHGEYLIGSFHFGRGEDYLGPDLRTRWYNRNLRIFHNLLRITSSPQERLLVIIGSGHLPILRHAAEASPEYRLVDVAEYLGR